jgi:hypothetical protein
VRGDGVRPRARRSGLVIRDLPGEVVVYDRDSHQAHCLNRTAALVFRNADGRRTVAELASLLTAECAAEATEDVVAAALETLTAAHLLESPETPPAGQTSRREALRRVSLGAAVLVPTVTSLLVPTPAEAANTCIQEADCPGATGQRCWNNDIIECEIQTNTCDGVGSCTN